jgi:hypothetical protein
VVLQRSPSAKSETSYGVHEVFGAR